MSRLMRARAMRRDRVSVRAIAAALNVHVATAYRLTADVEGEPRDDENTVVTYRPHNGGCSTQSGMMPIRMPRIRALHGDLQVAA